MIKPRVIIADEDESYIVPLQLKFVKDFFNKIDLEIISDKEYFNELFSRPQNVDVLIVSDALYDSSLQKHNISNIFVMMEQLEEGGTGDLNINRMFKYTSIKEIFNEIVGKSAGALNIGIVEKKETQIILVTSASGGVGKTTVAMGISSCLAMNYKRVLYINASRLQSFQTLLNNKTAISEQEIYKDLFKTDVDVYKCIKHTIRKEVFDYIPAFKAALAVLRLNYDIYEKIAVSVQKSHDYDFVIIDAENTFDEHKLKLMDLADKVIIVTEQDMHSVEATNDLISNINFANSEKYFFVCNKFCKERNNSLVSSAITLKFSVCEYIEELTDIERDDLNKISKSNGIKKVSYILV